MTCSNGGESARGVPYLACRGGGGSMAQRDPHVALIISTTNMWGKNFWWKNFSTPKNLCSDTFGSNICSYTKQGACHGSPFLFPAPPLREQFSVAK